MSVSCGGKRCILFTLVLFGSQQHNRSLSSSKQRHLVLQFSSSSAHFVEMVEIAPPLSIPLEQLLSVEVCQTFAVSFAATGANKTHTPGYLTTTSLS